MITEKYHSRNEIENKLSQSKYVLKQFKKFKNRLFVFNGLDKESGSYPIQTHFNSFLSHTRSIIQYANKEAKVNNKLSLYNEFINEHKIFNFFKELRNCDIHEYTLATSTTIIGESHLGEIHENEGEFMAEGKPFSILVETLDDLDNPKGKNDCSTIVISFGKKIKLTDELKSKLEREGNLELLEAFNEGKNLYEEQSYDGENDIFLLCDKYMYEIERFIEFGIKTNFIT